MDEEKHRYQETNLERIRSAIVGLFPQWLRWLLGAIILTGVSLLLLESTKHFGFRSGTWHPTGHRGPYFDGGHDVMLLIASSIGSVYCWGMSFGIFLEYLRQKRRLVPRSKKSKVGSDRER